MIPDKRIFARDEMQAVRKEYRLAGNTMPDDPVIQELAILLDRSENAIREKMNYLVNEAANKDRRVGVILRTRPDDRDELKRKAKSCGKSLQKYLSEQLQINQKAT